VRFEALLRALAVVLAAAVAAHADVRFEHDRVTARFDAMPVGDAIQALAAATGGEVHGGVVAQRDVTLELHEVTLEEALGRLLGQQSFTVRYGEGGRVKAIVLKGGPEAPPPPMVRSPAAGVPIVAEKPTFPIVLSRMFERHRPLELSKPLAEKLGEDKASMPRLLEIATGDDDGITRAQATQIVLSALEREGRYRRSLLRTLHRLPPEELAAITTGPSGERFQELLEFLASHSREPTLQKKAGVVLDQMRESRI
jgi:hypothetical protein